MLFIIISMFLFFEYSIWVSTATPPSYYDWSPPLWMRRSSKRVHIKTAIHYNKNGVIIKNNVSFFLYKLKKNLLVYWYLLSSKSFINTLLFVFFSLSFITKSRYWYFINWYARIAPRGVSMPLRRREHSRNFSVNAVFFIRNIAWN